MNRVCSLLNDLSLQPSTCPLIYYDYIGANQLCSNPVFHSRMKHVAIKFHFIRDQMQNGTQRVAHCQKVEENVLGPGGGAGIGCGVGVGFGLVGGIGYGGWPWNHLKLAFGVGAGCGIGFGFGFGQGIGYGFSLESLESNLSKDSSDSNRKFLIS
ncbi:protein TRIGALACTOSYLDIACYLGLYCEROL 5, chloroplastic [Gossypium australe]|uniref:Protein TRIGALACTOSYLDIACYLGLYCEROL 5, chloroplastic n=1 Tax=Gossypium australe TaxID=47621 RepID=A0A5B6UTI4_9ROSI|nr:protein TRIGALACTOSYLDIACYLGLYCEROL 5, chloroplastic [Gossypium australe]